MRAPEPCRVLGAAVVIAGLVLVGCASGGEPPMPPPVTGTLTPSLNPTPTPLTVPADGVTLRSLGYVNGPAEQFTLPRTALVSAAVDQPNNVTAVLSSPPPAEVEAYLRRALPATGFTVTATDPAGSALTFVGHGWTGSFTASEATSAILLRPV